MHRIRNNAVMQDDDLAETSATGIPATPIIDVEMSPRAYQVLYTAGCRTMRDVAALSLQKLSSQPNCGEALLAEVNKILRTYGTSLADAPTPAQRRVRLQKKRGELMRDVRDMDKEISKLQSAAPPRTVPMDEKLVRLLKRRSEFMTVIKQMDREIDELRQNVSVK